MPKPGQIAKALLTVLAATGLVSAAIAPAMASKEELRFGTVTLYRDTPHPAHVVLFVSGDGG